jgi:hypothetical protein
VHASQRTHTTGSTKLRDYDRWIYFCLLPTSDLLRTKTFDYFIVCNLEVFFQCFYIICLRSRALHSADHLSVSVAEDSNRAGGRIYSLGEASGAGYLFCCARQSAIAVTVRVTLSRPSNWEIQPPKTKRWLVAIWAILTMLTSVKSASRTAVRTVQVKCILVLIKRDTCSSKTQDRELLD